MRVRAAWAGGGRDAGGSPRRERQFVRQRNQRIGRHLQILRVAAMGIVAVDLDRHLLAGLLPSGAAMVALGAALIMMHHHALADVSFLRTDRGADRDHHAARFVPGDHRTVTHWDARRLRLTFGAAVLMQVAAAHAGRLHLDDDVVSIWCGIGELHQFQPAFAREYNAAHRSLRLFLLWPDFEPKRRDWQSANRKPAEATNDDRVPLPAPRLA